MVTHHAPALLIFCGDLIRFKDFRQNSWVFLSAAAGGGLALDFLDASDTQYTTKFKYPSNIQKGHIGSI